jgi:hypothetical protein
MGAFKKLLASDVIVTPFEVNKGFTFRGVSEMTASDVGIDRFLGQNITGIFASSEATTGQVAAEYRRLIFNSVKELYYSNYQSIPTGDTASLGFVIPGLDSTGDVLTGPISSAGRYENYLQTTLAQSREFPTGSNAYIGVVSIPSKLYGDQIQPGSFRLINAQDSITVTDDSEGNLINQSSGLIVGQIFYSHGIAAITDNGVLGLDTYGTGQYGSAIYGSTDQTYIESLISSSAVTCSFSSSITLFETQYKCTVDTSEFNFSLNPSLISGSTDGTLYDFATGSYFNPYVTTVGLYNEAQDLIAVGKLSKPLPSNNTTDLTILINLDR